ncbi:MAG: type I polyketide synthase, partial [Bacteroidota bacterium]
MHNNQKETDYAALLKRSLLEMERLEKRVQQLEYQKREPIAIVGIGARFPGGGEGVEAFWDALKTATNAIREVPANRWDNDAYYDPDPNAAGKIYTTGGSFLDDVDQFDAAFFGISPREAKEMDPQQRLLLEVCWEALETASYAPNSLSGSATGVYMGIMNQDYSRLSDDFRHINMHSGTGNAISVVAGRLSDFFGFRGPTITLDTACSSSLVAVHLACQSLRSGECERALAGGVNLMLSPMANIVECRAHMLSPKGHCHTFDSAADGFARGEGCGVVVLKRLSDALRDRDHIWAVIRGNAVNHDGASGGLTVPNSNAQRALIRQALQMAGVQPTEVAYVEAHGTGTPLGDPIEMTALVAEYGADRTMEQPLLIGSVKSNFGHLEGAAGIVGFAKALLCLYHGKIPANLHFYNPNPHIAWDKIPVAIPTEYRDWPEGKDKRRAAVSSFGFSGTNAHMVLEEAPHLSSDGRKRHTEGEALLLTLSAKSPEALGQVCERFAHYFTQHQLTALQAADVCYAANIGRVDFPHRMAFVAENPASLQKQLSGGDAAEQSQEKKAGVLAKTVFVCPDFSREDCFLGAALYQSEPDFSAAFDRCVELLNRLEEGPWVERLLSLTDQKSQSESALYVLPLSFASKFALASLWMNWGIRPAAVMGCGTGLYVAACLSGTLALEDGLRLALAHARHLEKGENLVDDFPQVAADMSYGKAKLKWLDARTGTTVQMEELGEAYWRSAVTVNELPQHILTGLEKEHQLVISLDCPDSHKMMHNLAEWYALVDIDWKAFYRHAHNRAMPLPTYPFERKSYWLDLPKQEEKQLQKNFQNGVQKIGKQTLSDSSDRQPFCEWTWQAFDKKQTKPSAQSSDGPILLFMDERGVGEQLVAAFGKQKVAYTLIYKGRESSSQDQRKNGIDCHHWKGDDQKELHHLLSTKVNISDYHRIIYLWGVDAQETTS